MQKSFINSLPIVAQALGDKFGLNVVMGSRGAATNGTTIYLPMLPDDDERALVLARGYIDHEAAHVRVTDFGIWPTGIEHPLTNIFEDIRIEQDTMHRYPGSRKNLYDLIGEVINEGGFSMPSGDCKPFEIVHNFLLTRLRSEVLGQDPLAPIADAWEKCLDQTFPRDFKDTLEGIMARADRQQSTADALSLAREVIQAMKDHQQAQEEIAENPSQEGSGDAGEQEEANDGQSSDQSGDEASDENDATDDGAGSSADDSSEHDPDSEDGANGAGQSGQGEEEDQGQQAGGGDTDGDEGTDSDTANASTSGGSEGEEEGFDDQSQRQQASGRDSGGSSEDEAEAARDHADALSQALSDWVDQIDNDLGSLVEKLLDDQSVDALRNGQATVAMPVTGSVSNLGDKVFKEDVAKETQALRVKLAAKLRAQRIVPSAPKRNGRRIDTRAIHRMKTGDTRVFRSRRPRELPNTGIAVLLDQSGSMNGPSSENGRPSAIATKACMALAMATKGQKGIKTVIGGYRSEGDAIVTPYKEAGETLKVDQFRAVARGSTPTTEALWWGAHKLAAITDVDRRIILNITDGAPDEPRSTINAVKSIEALGMEVLALGIDCEIYSELASRRASIQSIKELPRELFSLLERELIFSAA